jgi:hypothetical protein
LLAWDGFDPANWIVFLPALMRIRGRAMRFVLYFFTWSIVIGTLSALAQADWENFLTGLFLSVPMLWWSKVVRDRRRRKLGLDTQPVKVTESGSKLKRAMQAARAEWANVPVLPGEETRRPSGDFNPQQAQAEEQTENPAIDKPHKETNSLNPEQGHSEESVQPELLTPQPLEAIPEAATSAETEPGSTALEVLDPPTDKPQNLEHEEKPGLGAKLWQDANGKRLHVGAQVSFFAKSKGQSVSIPGLLLGEREGKAVIEVQGGALLPANEYLIPWHVVSYRA